MSVKNLYPSKSNYLKAPDLAGRQVKATISKVSYSTFDDEQKINLHFVGAGKSLTLNKTNADTIATAYGDEEKTWIGKKIILVPAKTKNMQGNVVDTIKVMIDAPVVEGFQEFTNENPTATSPGDTPPDFDDGIPFN